MISNITILNTIQDYYRENYSNVCPYKKGHLSIGFFYTHPKMYQGIKFGFKIVGSNLKVLCKTYYNGDPLTTYRKVISLKQIENLIPSLAKVYGDIQDLAQIIIDKIDYERRDLSIGKFFNMRITGILSKLGIDKQYIKVLGNNHVYIYGKIDVSKSDDKEKPFRIFVEAYNNTNMSEEEFKQYITFFNSIKENLK